MAITYLLDKDVKSSSIREFFLSVNWLLGDKPEKLQRAFRHSDKVITAWDGKKLVGLINTIDDGALTAYIPYLLVNPAYQKQGIGKTLVGMIISGYDSYERIVLLTEIDTVDFYKKCGFIESLGIHSLLIVHQ